MQDWPDDSCKVLLELESQRGHLFFISIIPSSSHFFWQDSSHASASLRFTLQLQTFSRTLAYTRKYLTSRVGYPVTVLLRPPLFVVHHLGLQMLFVGAILLFCKRQAKTGRETTTVIGK